MTSEPGPKRWQPLKSAAIVAIVVWAAVSSWYAWQAGGGSRDSSGTVSADVDGTLTPGRESAAAKYFDQAPDQQKRFLAVVEAAKGRQTDGADTAAVRKLLTAAILAAASGNAEMVESRIADAEKLLNTVGLGTLGLESGDMESEAARLVVGLDPAYNLGQELLTEGHAAVEKLTCQASREFKAGQLGQTVSLLQLAAELAGAGTSAQSAPTMPEWFVALADAQIPTATQAEAEAAVGLAEAMIAAEPPAPPIVTLVKKSRQQLDAGQPAEARWWAGVALNALGVTDEAIAATTGKPKSS